jgi:hypothetical protein
MWNLNSTNACSRIYGTFEIITYYSQKDAPFLEFISIEALYISSGSSAHHQEHITVHTPSGTVNQY